LILPGFFCNYAARLSRKKAIIVLAALLAFFIVGLTPPEFRATLRPSNVARNLFRLLAVWSLAILSFGFFVSNCSGIFCELCAFCGKIGLWNIHSSHKKHKGHKKKGNVIETGNMYFDTFIPE
jgi:hypothetical protein